MDEKKPRKAGLSGIVQDETKKEKLEKTRKTTNEDARQNDDEL